MEHLKAILLASLVLLLPLTITAQTRRRGTARRPVAPGPAVVPPAAVSASTATPVRKPQPPAALAIVNAQTITTADIEPRAREQVEQLPEALAEARRQTLDLQINTTLLQVEAAKRKLTTQQLYNLEVGKKVTDPTPTEIKEFIETNRARLGEGPEEELRQQVGPLLRANREAKIQEDLVRRLRTANPVTMGVDINSPNLAAGAVLATVGGRPITAGTIIERLKPTLYKLQLNAYEVENDALDQTIFDLLLIAEANRRKVPPENIVRTEVSEKVHVPTDAEVEKFYAENKSRITGDFASLRNQIAEFLQEQDRSRLERELSDKLRKGADVRMLLAEPQPPVQAISVDDDPSRGDQNAGVTIVEFTDFQCPSCAAIHPILEEVLKTYGNKVRFVVRDFPLGMHQNARKAAEAANAANAQGKFFEYAALLFQRQNALDVASLKKYATELGLDRARFDAALDSGTYAAEVRHDVEDGEIYGVDRTPTIFINGVSLETLSAEALRAALDRALAAPKTSPE